MIVDHYLPYECLRVILGFVSCKTGSWLRFDSWEATSESEFSASWAASWGSPLPSWVWVSSSRKCHIDAIVKFKNSSKNYHVIVKIIAKNCFAQKAKKNALARLELVSKISNQTILSKEKFALIRFQCESEKNQHFAFTPQI